MRRPQAPTLTALALVAVASVALLSVYRPVGRAELLGAQPAKGSQDLESDLARFGVASRVGEDAVRDFGAGLVNDLLTGSAQPNMGPPPHAAASRSRVQLAAPGLKLAAPAKVGGVQLAAPAQAMEPVHDARAKSAAKDADEYFERIPVTSTHVPQLPAAKADEDIGSWFNRMPAHNVNAFHEASNAAHSAKYGNSESKARELDAYFNGLAASSHITRGPAGAQLKDLPADQAEAALSSYFDALPTRGVNAMHSSNGPPHEVPPLHPTPYTPHHKPLNRTLYQPQPQTLNPNPQPLNPTPHTLGIPVREVLGQGVEGRARFLLLGHPHAPRQRLPRAGVFLEDALREEKKTPNSAFFLVLCALIFPVTSAGFLELCVCLFRVSHPTHNGNVLHAQASALAAEGETLPSPRARAPAQRAPQVDAFLSFSLSLSLALSLVVFRSLSFSLSLALSLSLSFSLSRSLSLSLPFSLSLALSLLLCLSLYLFF